MQKVKVEIRCLVIKANNLRLRSHKVIIGVYRGQKIKFKQQKAKLIRLHFTHPYERLISRNCFNQLSAGSLKRRKT